MKSFKKKVMDLLVRYGLVAPAPTPTVKAAAPKKSSTAKKKPVAKKTVAKKAPAKKAKK